MSIVLKKDGHTTAPVSREEAQKLVNEGYEVWMNKGGVKFDKKTPKKSSKKKEEAK